VRENCADFFLLSGGFVGEDCAMASFQAFGCEIPGPYKPETALKAARRVRKNLGGPARLGFLFFSANYAAHLAELSEILRVDGHIRDLVGCTCGGRIEGRREMERGSGFVLLALSGDFGDPVVLESTEEGEAVLPDQILEPNGWITLSNPFSFPVEDWLKKWNRRFRGIPTVGGLASGGSFEDTVVFVNDRIVDAVAVPAIGRTEIVPVVSQGCRPIGEPLTVTRADHNILYALGSQSAYRVLESAFETLSEGEKSNARGNLFAGLAGTEYLDDFGSGDFLIKNILGADPDSGAVVIGGIPRVGQTLQYQIRDREAAVEDLRRAFEPARAVSDQAFGALLFSCLGRGSRFFGKKDQDAVTLSEALGDKPCAGFFCNGEIAPVRGLNALHGNTAAAAVLIEREA
jgi:small ligand-binding sensory domain FIST